MSTSSVYSQCLQSVLTASVYSEYPQSVSTVSVLQSVSFIATASTASRNGKRRTYSQPSVRHPRCWRYYLSAIDSVIVRVFYHLPCCRVHFAGGMIILNFRHMRRHLHATMIWPPCTILDPYRITRGDDGKMMSKTILFLGHAGVPLLFTVIVFCSEWFFCSQCPSSPAGIPCRNASDEHTLTAARTTTAQVESTTRVRRLNTDPTVLLADSGHKYYDTKKSAIYDRFQAVQRDIRKTWTPWLNK